MPVKERLTLPIPIDGSLEENSKLKLVGELCMRSNFFPEGEQRGTFVLFRHKHL